MIEHPREVYRRLMRRPRIRGVVRTQVDGLWFMSKREAERYKELRLLEFGRQIADLGRQIRFDLFVCGEKVAVYVADFVYTDTKTNQVIVEDCKGYRTDVYKLKKKLMKIIYKIEILET